MGMYTELHFNSKLKKDVPAGVLDALGYMLGQCEAEPVHLPQHPLFKTKRWGLMLVCDSYYFDADTHSTLRFDEIGNTHYLCVRSNLKNYDSEIEKFIDWIMPYLDKYEGDFLGFYRYEECGQPSLVYYGRPR